MRQCGTKLALEADSHGRATRIRLNFSTDRCVLFMFQGFHSSSALGLVGHGTAQCPPAEEPRVKGR